MRKKTFTAAALLAVASLTLSACGSGSGDSGEPSPWSREAAPRRRPPSSTIVPEADLVLTDTNGEEYDLRAETAGKPTLIYFGYTHCPDVCPLTMNNLAVAKKQLPREQQDELRLVFVTTDPGT
ncbi:hypothetical protein GCM10023238_34280 [Streptomyces heliomycini]